MKNFSLRFQAWFKRPILFGLLATFTGFGAGEAARAGSNDLNFVVGAGHGPPGTQVVIPIQVNRFTNMNEFQFSFHWNPTNAAFLDVEQWVLPGGGSYGTTLTNTGTMTLSWDDPYGLCETLADGTTVFMVRFLLVGSPGPSSSVWIDGAPTLMEAADLNMNPVPITLNSGWIQIDPPVNTPPVLAPIRNQNVTLGQTLAFTATATDTDLPPQTLSFSLDAGAPLGALIDPLSGHFTWTPTAAQTLGTYSVTMRVTDNGTPPLEAWEQITIRVWTPPRIGLASRMNGSQVQISLPSVPGQPYRIDFKDHLEDASWTSLPDVIVGDGTVLSIPDDITGQAQRFYRIVLQH